MSLLIGLLFFDVSRNLTSAKRRLKRSWSKSLDFCLTALFVRYNTELKNILVVFLKGNQENKKERKRERKKERKED